MKKETREYVRQFYTEDQITDAEIDRTYNREYAKNGIRGGAPPCFAHHVKLAVDAGLPIIQHQRQHRDDD